MINIIKKEFIPRKKFIQYVIVLRCFAAILITNSHYHNIYPNELMASGGLLGDILFFAISGFGLIRLNSSFIHWYSKRISRIYLPVFLITAIYLLVGFYHFDIKENLLSNIIYWFIFPTYYHFVASIVVLYVLFYFVVKVQYFRENLLSIALLVFLIKFIVYILLYDGTYYHIDNVREPFIRFLFFEAMLVGAHFRLNNFVKSKNIPLLILANIFLLITYFFSKWVFVNYPSLSEFQIINQILIIILLFCIFSLMSCFEGKFKKMNLKIKFIFNFIAALTFEIYLVQYVIIALFEDLVFPLNWITVTFIIIVSALILRIITVMLKATISYFKQRGIPI